jgi:hypothetical protein
VIRELIATAIRNWRRCREERRDTREFLGEDLCDLIRQRWGAW